MNDEQRDLLAALAADDLELDDRARGEALLGQGPEYREEYEAQLSALAALADAGPTGLSDVERARLHREVMAVVAAPAQADRSEPRSLRWLRPLAIAAAAVVVVGFAGVSLLGGNRAADDATFSEAATDRVSLQTTTSGRASAQQPDPDDGDSLGGAEATEDADSPANLSALEGESAKSLDLGAVNSRDIDDRYLTDIFLGAAQYTSDAPGSLRSLTLTCAPSAEQLSSEPLLAFGTAVYDGQDAQYFGFESRRLIFLLASDCTVIGDH